jgi:hypothetical protein
MSKWIKCSDEFPEEDQIIIASGFIYDDKSQGRWVEQCVFSDGVFYACAYDSEQNLTADFDIQMYEPTHWMPLPDAPEDDE